MLSCSLCGLTIHLRICLNPKFCKHKLARISLIRVGRSFYGGLWFNACVVLDGSFGAINMNPLFALFGVEKASSVVGDLFESRIKEWASRILVQLCLVMVACLIEPIQ